MADSRAVSVLAEAVVRLLETSAQAVDFNNQLEFRVFTSRDFANPMSNGVSLFVYRIFPNGVHRTPTGRIGADGQRLKTALPVDIHFLLTVWGGEATLQHELAGWLMRVLEDNPILPAAVLNAVTPEVFRPEENLEIGLAELRTEDLLRIWEVLGLNVYQLSIPYFARIVHLESVRTRSEGAGGIVQDRTQRFGVQEPPEALA